MPKRLKNVFKNPYIRILLSFVILVAIGTIAFILPICTAKDAEPLGFVDALFLATSASCVTGLTTCANIGAQLNIIGKIILIFLIFCGGLGLITIYFSLFLIFGYIYKKDLNLTKIYLLKEFLNLNNAKEARSYLKDFIIIAIVIELLGTIYFTFWFLEFGELDFGNALLNGAFHSVSSFNNAGIDILGDSSLKDATYRVGSFLGPTMALIVMGGLGFVFYIDIKNSILKAEDKNRFHLSLHTILVLIVNIILFTIGFTGIYFGQKGSGAEVSLLEAAFMSVSARTAGFSVIDMGKLTTPTVTIMLPIMLIGGSPCSTAGGIKTITIIILISFAMSYILGKKKVTLFHRNIDAPFVKKCQAIFILALLWITIVSIIIGFAEQINGNVVSLDRLLFETVSAYATVGLSMNLTCSLCNLSKIFLILTMMFGRLGIITFINIANIKAASDISEGNNYPSESVFIG